MEKVQYQQQATLPEHKDLHEKGLFAKVHHSFALSINQADNQNEIDQITKRRTGFETSLIRRQTRKEDFFKYAEYEINLERLRKVRWKRLSTSNLK
jgi:U3 small nucleolar RNA-associated protein 6